MDMKELRASTGLSQDKFSAYFGIPPSTLRKWEQGVRKPPEYVTAMVARLIKADGMEKGKEANQYDRT